MTTTKLTPKQLEILLLFYRFRFLNRPQIQQFLNHKNHRRIQSRLNNLLNAGIIGRIYSTKFGENTKPAIYYLALGARKILKGVDGVDNGQLKRVYREKNKSQRFVDHHIMLGNVCLYFQNTVVKNAEYNKLHFLTKTELIQFSYLPEKLPDAYIAIEAKKETKRYFLEIIDEGTPRFAIRATIKKHIDFADSGDWESNTQHPFPKILLVCPTQAIKKYLQSNFIPRALDDEGSEVEFYLTTTELIRGTGNVWEKVRID